MKDMSGKMSTGAMSPALQKQMGDRMRAMAGMLGQGKMMNADNQKRMEEMRAQMNALRHDGK